MIQGLPFLFMRRRQIVENGETRFETVYVVKQTRCHDYRHYPSGWMDDPLLGSSETDEDLVFVPDVDFTEHVFVFDGPDAQAEEQKALAKMKELWSRVTI
jgi:hypothetical protein